MRWRRLKEWLYGPARKEAQDPWLTEQLERVKHAVEDAKRACLPPVKRGTLPEAVFVDALAAEPPEVRRLLWCGLTSVEDTVARTFADYCIDHLDPERLVHPDRLTTAEQERARFPHLLNAIRLQYEGIRRVRRLLSDAEKKAVYRAPAPPAEEP